MATILIIDDEASIRKMLTALLEREGHSVIFLPDAELALERLDFDTIDLIITDLVMPTRGEDAIHAIRSSGITVPIIVLSGYLQPGDGSLLKTIGANRVLSKPARRATILNAISELLSTC